VPLTFLIFSSHHNIAKALAPRSSKTVVSSKGIYTLALSYFLLFFLTKKEANLPAVARDRATVGRPACHCACLPDGRQACLPLRLLA